MQEETKFWNERYENGVHSGNGSYGEQLDKKLAWLKNLDVTSITEVGCGDFNFGKRVMELFPKASYFGTDISDVIIERNKILYPFAQFEKVGHELPKSDLLLCVDVLFHVYNESDVSDLLDTLEKTWTKYLVVTAYERDQVENLSEHIRIRKFDYQRFGTPLLREICEEDGDLYFYIFQK